MRQLQSPEVDTGQVLLTLRDSLDQLKLSIDSLNLPAGDITALLANLRYRLEPRFAAMGMQLDWQVDELPVLHRLDAGAMRQLLFILFESISNTLQHAHARRLHVQARAASPPGQQQVRIVLEDDGCGFDVAASSTRGLASMRQRARLLGAELQVQSTPKGTRIELGLS
jgi:signal transduction histidine kinase